MGYSYVFFGDFVNVQIIGKGIDIGDSLSTYAKQEVNNLTQKYLGDPLETFVAISKESKLFEVEIVIKVNKGFKIKTNGSSDDPYKAVASAIERAVERIKKHKNKLKDKKRRASWDSGELIGKSYTLERNKATAEDTDEAHLIIAETDKYILSLSVSEAVMRLDLEDINVAMFKNAETGRINVVYKRPDGHIGWIDYSES